MYVCMALPRPSKESYMAFLGLRRPLYSLSHTFKGSWIALDT